MDAASIVTHLLSRGLAVTLEADGIHVAPRNRLTPETRELIRANRGRLIEHLGAKFKTPMSGTVKTDTSPSVSSDSPVPVHSETTGTPFGGSVGPLDDHFPTPQVDLRDCFPLSLAAGTLVVCNGCRHFEGRPTDRPDGWCRHFDVDTWEQVPFHCDSFFNRRSP